jgi:hypothetical protein
MGTGIKMKKNKQIKPIATDLRFTGSLKPEFKITNQQIETWLKS